MQEYIFLFLLAGIWLVIASVQDIRKTEVANWLTFSLVGFALAYRAFYSAFSSDWRFFYLGVLGLVVFFVLGNIFYYSKVFAGADAKLLMGMGVVLPYSSYSGLFFEGFGFIFALFVIGWVYSFAYTFFLIRGRGKSFKKDFRERFYARRGLFYILLLVGLIFLVLLRDIWGIVVLAGFVLFYLLFIYTKTLERCCMVEKVSPNKLQEGDWLDKDVRIGGKVVKKSVHGLSLREIEFLKNKGKSVEVLRGIPFVPAFLLTWIFMVFFYLVLEFSFSSLLAF